MKAQIFEFGRSPAMTALIELRRANAVFKALTSDEAHTISMCISFWETRKIKGWLTPFWMFHNVHCQFKADHYRAELRKLMERAYAQAA